MVIPSDNTNIGRKHLHQTSGHWGEIRSGIPFSQFIHHVKEKSFIKAHELPTCEILDTNRGLIEILPLRIAEFGTVYRYEQSGDCMWIDTGAFIYPG